MPRYICHLDGLFFEWSTVVDAPITYGMSEADFRDYYRDEYGRTAIDVLDDRLNRARVSGTSSGIDRSLSDLIIGNRAGPDESEASLAELRAFIAAPETRGTE